MTFAFAFTRSGAIFLLFGSVMIAPSADTFSIALLNVSWSAWSEGNQSVWSHSTFVSTSTFGNNSSKWSLYSHASTTNKIKAPALNIKKKNKTTQQKKKNQQTARQGEGSGVVVFVFLVFCWGGEPLFFFCLKRAN